MNLAQKIRSEIPVAMKAKDAVRLQALRALQSEFQYEEMQKGSLSNDDIIAILKREIKKRNESLEFENKANRQDAIEVLKKEISVIEEFLPSQLSEDKLKEILLDLKSKGVANMGLAMKELKTSFAGQYDAKRASELAKEIFG
jgi:uncharacterized protein YqeY